MAMNKYLSTITLNLNGLTASTKRHNVADWIRKHEIIKNKKIKNKNKLKLLKKRKEKKMWPTHILPTRDTPQKKKEVKGWKNTSKQMGREKNLVCQYILSDKIDFKTKTIKRDIGGHFTILKGRIHQGHKYYKHICTQHRSTQIYKENLGWLQERYRQQHNYNRRF